MQVPLLKTCTYLCPTRALARGNTESPEIPHQRNTSDGKSSASVLSPYVKVDGLPFWGFHVPPPPEDRSNLGVGPESDVRYHSMPFGITLKAYRRSQGLYPKHGGWGWGVISIGVLKICTMIYCVNFSCKEAINKQIIPRTSSFYSLQYDTNVMRKLLRIFSIICHHSI